MKCSHCGLESEVQQAFLVEKRWFGLFRRAYCPACQSDHHAWSVLVSMAMIAGAGLLMAAVFPGSWLSGFWLRLFLVLLFSLPMVILHELAHVTAGLLLGLRVFRVVVGYGKRVYSGRRLGIHWELRILPFGGFTMMASPPSQGARLRTFLAILAGPAVHGAMLALSLPVLFLLLILDRVGTAAYEVAALLFWGNALLLVLNLIPHKTPTPSGSSQTDGGQLIRLALLTSDGQRVYDQAYYFMETLEALGIGDYSAAESWAERGLTDAPGTFPLTNCLGVALLSQGKFAGASDLFRGLIDSPEAKENPILRNLALNNVAYTDLFLGRPELMAEAESYSAEALKNLPWEPSLLGTRGAVLAERGDYAEGIRLLKLAMQKHTEDRPKAINACHIAIAERRRGNAQAAASCLELARRLDEKCFLLARAEEIIRSA